MEARRYTPHYTVADYEQWEGAWELWGGIPVAMSPSPRFDHQEVLIDVATELRTQLKRSVCRCRMVVEHDWRIADDMVVRPDMSIVCREFSGAFLNVPPTLIVEILSLATEHKDRTAKFELYAEQGVLHYLIVDTRSGNLEPWSLPEGRGQYEAAPGARSAACQLTLHEGCSLTVAREGWLPGS